MKHLFILILVSLFTGLAKSQNGTVDINFNPNDLDNYEGDGGYELYNSYGIEQKYSSIVENPDGKLLVVGWFYLYNGKKTPALFRLNSDGKLDTSFKPQNIRNDEYYNRSFISSICLQNNGKIIVATDTSGVLNETLNNSRRIFRLNQDGNLDTSFREIRTNGVIKTMCIIPDGRIIIGGNFTIVDGFNKKYLACINSDGTLDQTFNNIGSGPNAPVLTTLYHERLGLFIGGKFTRYNNSRHTYIASLNNSGFINNLFQASIDSLATAYESNGTIYNFLEPGVYKLAQYDSTRIMLAGAFERINNTNVSGGIVRIDGQGNLDNSFNYVPTNPSNLYCNNFIVQNDKIIKISYDIGFGSLPIRNLPFLTRLHANGSVDASFLYKYSRVNNGFVYNLNLDHEGKILATGSFMGGITRLSFDGNNDLSFNAGIGSGFKAGNVNTIVKLANNNMLVGGEFFTYQNKAANNIVRINQQGELDSTFNISGFVTASVTKMIQQPDGKVLILGRNIITVNGVDHCVRLVRVNANGSIDQTFNVLTQINNLNTGNFLDIRDAILQPDGKILVTIGWIELNDGLLKRLNSDGTIDPLFNQQVLPGRVISIALQTDGKIIVSAYSNSGPILWRLYANGNQDTSFYHNLSINPPPLSNSLVDFIYVLSNGQILISKISGNNNGFFRLFPNGKIDTTFSTSIPIPQPRDMYGVKNVIELENGKLLIGGYLMDVNYTLLDTTLRRPYVGIMKLLPNGKTDSSFNFVRIHSRYDSLFEGRHSYSNSIAMLGNDKIIMGGSFYTCNNIPKNKLAIINICPVYVDSTNVTIRASQLPYQWRGNNYVSAGNYTFSTNSSSGCDSIFYLRLTVLGSTQNMSASVCSNQLPYVWNNNSYANSGTYWGYFINATGEDSVVILQLSIKPTSSKTLNQSVCSNQLPYQFNGNSINQSGVYTDTLINSVGCDSVITLHLTVNSLPTVSAGTYDSVSVFGSPILLAGTPSGGTFSGIGVTNNIFYPASAGIGTASITYQYTNPTTGCANTAQTVIVVKNACFFSVSNSISGPTNICDGALSIDSVVYKINTIDAASLNWIVSNPTTMKISTIKNRDSVKIIFTNSFTSGTISVSVAGNCNGSISRTLTIRKSAPFAPGLIKGPVNVCSYVGSAAGTPAAYSISPVAGAVSYTWTVPAGWRINGNGTSVTTPDTAVNITFPANFSADLIRVTANNACGSSGQRTLSVRTSNPALIYAITGKNDVCNDMVSDTLPNGRAVTFTIRQSPNINSYIWSVPTGATITERPGGQGTSTDTIIKVVFNQTFTGGAITVRGVSGCFTTPDRSYTVNRRLPIARSFSLTSSNLTCPIRTYNFSLTNTTYPTLASKYMWEVNNGQSINGRDDTTFASVSFGSNISGSYTIRVRGVNNCGFGTYTSRTFFVPVCRTPLTQIGRNSTESSITNSIRKTIIFPNPSNSQFQIQLATENLKDLISISVFDVNGKLVERLLQQKPNSIITVGHNWKPGVYMTIISQGTKIINEKLIKY